MENNLDIVTVSYNELEEGDVYPDLFYRFRIPGIFIVKTVTKIISTHPGGQKPAVSP